MKTFEDMELPGALKQALQQMQFSEPTPVQAEAIPLALEGKDILGSAQTGTGKTGAFGIPLVAKLLSDPESSALVMTPTRELASQVMGQLRNMLGEKSKIKTALLIGGQPMSKQLAKLKSHVRLFVGTPGRINDHLTRKKLDLTQTTFLVLDETDRMLDMGFTEQIENVVKHMPAERQTLLFSATLPKNIVRIANQYLRDPVRVAISQTTELPNITQKLIKVTEAEKYDRLCEELQEREGSIVIFVKTKYGTEKIAKQLSKEGHRASAIHGDLRQSQRGRVIDGFRSKKSRILVATDVAARGLDIPHIEHVINYDLPQCAEDYIHRIGRTARAGAEGSALNLVAPVDKNKWGAIQRLLNSDGEDFESNQFKRGGGRRGSGFRGKRRGGNARGNSKGGFFKKGKESKEGKEGSKKFKNKKNKNKGKPKKAFS